MVDEQQAAAHRALGARGGGAGRPRPARRPRRRRVLPADRPGRHAARRRRSARNEAFAPLVVAFPFDDFDDAIRQVNDSFYGLQTGVFTNDLAHSWQAFNELEVGGVIVNDVPTYRIDHMPYGGVKDSGLGREGLRWSIEDMTELRLMVVAQPDKPARARTELAAAPAGRRVVRSLVIRRRITCRLRTAQRSLQARRTPSPVE